jgi:hypothetical protein
MEIIGRIREKRLLKNYLEKDNPEFLVVFGRRRAGKTFLVREFFGGDFCFYCTGLESERAEVQLKSFHEALNKYGSEPFSYKDNWFDAFTQLTRLVETAPSGQKKVIFLDETPWMDTHKSGFLTGLEYFWNSFASSRPDVLLIVCGSATSWIVKKLFRNTGGLYNRVTKQMHIRPFTLYECEQFFRERDVAINRYEITESHMVFGGNPYYLDYFEKGLSFAQNVDQLCFSENAPLKYEFDRLYGTLFDDPGGHIDVVRALARKKSGLTRTELLADSGYSNGGGFSRILSELAESDFIRRYPAFSKKSRDAAYRLVDPFTLFYLHFMDKKSTDTSYWSHNITDPSHRAWAGLAFEQVCFLHIEQIKAALGISGVHTEISAWRGKGAASRDGQRPDHGRGEREPSGAQVDLVIDRRDQVVNLCECKYSIHEFTVTKEYERALRNKIAVFAEETGALKALHTTMITTYGVKRNEYSGIVQSEVTMDDLFKDI